jgi:ABC-type phosphate/phosphonate transport system substrate-binding protein
VALCATAAAVLAAGCQAPTFSKSIVNPLNLELPFLPYEKPVRIGVAHQHGGIFDPSRWDIAQVGSPWSPLRTRLERSLKRPVQIEELEPFQIAAHLHSGRLDFALLPAKDYLAVEGDIADAAKVIAMSQAQARQGLIVVRASSSIQSIPDLKGRRFAFGPAGDQVLDIATKQALTAGGLKPDELFKELLPVPNTFQHHISANESAYEVVYGIGTEAGVIEKSDYDAYPQRGGSLLLRTFSKENFRVLGQTDPVQIETIPDGPVLASATTDAKLVEHVQAFLLDAQKDQKDAMRALGLAGFRKPASDVNGEIQRMAAAELGSPTPSTAPPPSPAATPQPQPSNATSMPAGSPR